MTDTEPTVDLGAVQWSVEYRLGLPFVVGLEHQPDGYDEVVYELRPGYTRDTNGADRTDLFADMVARKLSETDNGWRASWQRAVDEVNRTRTRMRAIDAAATDLLALSRDRNVCSPGPAFEVALGELSRAMDARGA